jgi:hypothetical protein
MLGSHLRKRVAREDHPLTGSRRGSPHRPARRRSSAQRIAAAASAIAGLGCLLTGWLVHGRPGLLAGLVALVLVVGFFVTGSIPLLLADGTGARSGAALMLLLLTYTLRLAVVLFALALIAGGRAVDSGWLGVSIIICALVWCAVHVGVVIHRSRT